MRTRHALTAIALTSALCSGAAPARAGEGAAVRLPRPAWQPGSTWTYLRTPEGAPDEWRTIEYTALYRVRLEGGEDYVLRRDGKEFLYSLDLGFRLIRGEKVERENRPAFDPFRGLWQGLRRWEQRLQILVTGEAPITTLGTFHLVGRERVAVAAGAFDAYRITYREGNDLSREYWYAPAVRWVVREKVHWSEGGWADELQRYRLR